MNMKLTHLLFTLITFFIVISGKAQKASTGILYRFATQAEAQMLITEIDQYTNSWNQFDLDVRLQKQEGRKSQLLRLGMESTRGWSEAEKTKANKAFATIYSYYELMREKLCDDTFPLKEKFLPICLRLLSFELFHQVTKNIEAQEREEKPSRQEQIFNMFLECLNNNYKKERSLTFYANQLCLSPKHMSRCIVSFSGRPATEWIRNLVILEAKVLLRTRKYTIQQICYMLNFPNASFFGKYFKEAVGISPKQYQQNHI